LPGSSFDKPNVYEFGISYEEIQSDLKKKDKTLYTQNGMLHILDRNRRIKRGPQRLQESLEKYDIIFTAEERVYDQVVEHFENCGNVIVQPCHVINIDIQDNHEEATIGAFLMCELVTNLAETSDIDNDIDELLQEFEAKCNRQILHTVVFY
jgi:RNA polymerase II subunit A C-terminal domain phosphatase SSU72